MKTIPYTYKLIFKSSNQYYYGVIWTKHSMKVQKERGNYSPPKPPKGEFKCPHCEKVGVNYGSMMSHHFDRCQYKTK